MMRARHLVLSVAGASLIALCAATPLPAADAAAPGAKDAKAESDINLPPFPADKTAHFAMQLGGQPLKYDATVGSIPVLDEKGKTIAQVMYTAYTVPGANRPVTFALNGGPGASSVYLNLGAIGPKRVQFGADGDSPSDPSGAVDNPGTWLDFTDLVFIDPVGTGFSHALVDEQESKKRFYTPKSDVEYLSRVVFDWLVKNERLGSRKYFVGESYGGFRGPRIAHFLETRLGIALSGMVLVSPYLEPTATDGGDFSPLPWIVTLPSIAAANLERQGRLTDAAMADVMAYARSDYALDLLKGRSDPGALDRIVARVVALTGLDAGYVRRQGGRLDVASYLREVHRDQGKIASVYDSNVAGWDPFPYSARQRANDPLLDGVVAPTTTAMVDFITRQVGWKYAGRYNALSYEVNGMWKYTDDEGEDASVRHGSVEELRQVLAMDPKVEVLVAHGWDDLTCSFMTSVLIADQMPQMGAAARMRVREYPGGHMFYSRAASSQAFRADVRALFGQH